MKPVILGTVGGRRLIAVMRDDEGDHGGRVVDLYEGIWDSGLASIEAGALHRAGTLTVPELEGLATMARSQLEAEIARGRR